MKTIVVAFMGLVMLFSKPAYAQTKAFNSERLEKIDAVINKHITASHISGATASFLKTGKLYTTRHSVMQIWKQRRQCRQTIFLESHHNQKPLQVLL
ncbi:hypothetical protein [Chryseobacterium oranimense]|uniref:hypothetical protein n=1 Tax=Chryseobacterium oranimense TaxID=421058 RepID=UPI000AD6F7F9|nr:hypothetical protein [Chryseobacterium oranimense]